MFCGNCGTEVKEGAQFCQECGAPLAKKPEVRTAVSVAKKEVARKERRGGKMPVALLAGIAAVVVALALVICFLGGVFDSPATKVGKALVKSGNAFNEMMENLQLTGLSDFQGRDEVSQDMSVWLDKNSNPLGLDNLGIRVSVDTSLPDRVMAMSFTPFVDDSDLVNLQLKVENEKLYIGSPELTDDVYYMVNTATFGEDFYDLMGAEEIRDLSFNLFDLMEEIERINASNEEQLKAIQKAYEEFTKAIEVKKADAEKIEVNEHSLKCDAYQVVITEDALENLLDALEDVYEDMDQTDEYIELLESMGIPREVTDEMEYTMEGSVADTGEMRDVMEELGDIELELYIHDGYVVAAVYETSIEDTDMEMILNIGGGKNYVDDISLQIIVDEVTMSIVSTGNHLADDGKFDDETVVEMRADGEKQVLARMEATYSPEKENDNFEWMLKAEDMKISAAGTIHCSSKAVSVCLDDVKVGDYAAFGFEYSIGKYEKDDIKITNSVELGELSEDELTDEVMDLSENITEWMQDLLAEYPELESLFY